jgi:hypothetical protein
MKQMNCIDNDGKFVNYEDDHNVVQVMTLSYYMYMIEGLPRDDWDKVLIYKDMDMKGCGRCFQIYDLPFNAYREGDIFSVMYDYDDYIIMINDDKNVILVRDDFYCKNHCELEINLNEKIYKILRTYKLLEEHCPTLL